MFCKDDKDRICAGATLAGCGVDAGNIDFHL